MKKIAIVTDQLPREAYAGYLVYINSFVRRLARCGYQIEIVLTRPNITSLKWRAPPRTRLHGDGLIRLGENYFFVSPFAAAVATKKALFSILPLKWREMIVNIVYGEGGAIVRLGRFSTLKQIENAAKRIKSIAPDLILFNSIFVAGVLEKLQTHPKTYVITHDILYRRVDRLKARGYKVYPTELTKDRELDILSKFDLIIAIQENEKSIFEKLLPHKRITEVPYPVRIFRNDSYVRDSLSCIFVGSAAVHNVDGLRWFIDSVWPAVLGHVPAASLHVYGTVCRELERSAKGVVLHGPVADLKEPCFRSSVAIAPILAGSGLKIKILEYLSHGLPCVTTSVGMDGFRHVEELPIIVADTADDFAVQVVRILKDPNLVRTMEEFAYKYCEIYSEDNVFRLLEAMIAEDTAISGSGGGLNEALP